MEPEVAGNFLGLEFKDIVLNTAIIAAVFKVIWTFVTWVLDHLRLALMRRTETVSIPLGPYKPEYERIADFCCLVVRYGTDQYLDRLASDKERFDGRLRNKILRVEKGKDERGNYVFILRLPVHKRIGTQFKCFADAASAEAATTLERLLRGCPLIEGVSLSSGKRAFRYYFLLKDRFGVVESVDGVRNNFCYPV